MKVPQMDLAKRVLAARVRELRDSIASAEEAQWNTDQLREHHLEAKRCLLLLTTMGRYGYVRVGSVWVKRDGTKERIP